MPPRATPTRKLAPRESYPSRFPVSYLRELGHEDEETRERADTARRVMTTMTTLRRAFARAVSRVASTSTSIPSRSFVAEAFARADARWATASALEEARAMGRGTASTSSAWTRAYARATREETRVRVNDEVCLRRGRAREGRLAIRLERCSSRLGDARARRRTDETERARRSRRRRCEWCERGIRESPRTRSCR